MTLAAEKQMEHIGETQAVANHDHDMIHELGKRIDAIWRFDQDIANADADDELSAFWTDLKAREEENVRQLKRLVAKHVKKNCF